jgi:glutathionylspermidine synthase
MKGKRTKIRITKINKLIQGAPLLYRNGGLLPLLSKLYPSHNSALWNTSFLVSKKSQKNLIKVVKDITSTLNPQNIKWNQSITKTSTPNSFPIIKPDVSL